MTIYILSKNDEGSFTKWAETNNQAGLFKFAQYFASSCYCKDFIILFKEDNYAIRFTGYCDQMGIPIRFKRKEVIKNDHFKPGKGQGYVYKVCRRTQQKD